MSDEPSKCTGCPTMISGPSFGSFCTGCAIRDLRARVSKLEGAAAPQGNCPNCGGLDERMDERGECGVCGYPPACGCDESVYLRGKLERIETTLREEREAASKIPKRPVLPEGTDAARRITALEATNKELHDQLVSERAAHDVTRHVSDCSIRAAEAKVHELEAAKPGHRELLRTSRALIEAVRFLRYIAGTSHLGSPEHVTDLRERANQHADALEALTK